MKYHFLVELEPGDTVRMYDDGGHTRGVGVVIEAGQYDEKRDLQRLVVQMTAKRDKYTFLGRIESKESAPGYDVVPVLMVDPL